MEQIPLKLGLEGLIDSRLTKAALVINNECYVDWRHSYIFQGVMKLNKYERLVIADASQGFVDQHGFYYSREVAAKIAFNCKQVKELDWTIFSEDLWDKDGTPRDGGVFNPMGDKD